MRIRNGILEFSKVKNPDGKVWRDHRGRIDYWYYIAFPSSLPKSLRYWGYEYVQYDHQIHESFGFWFFNVSWSLPSSARKIQ